MAGKKRRKNLAPPLRSRQFRKGGARAGALCTAGTACFYPGAGQAYEQPVAQEGKKKKTPSFL